MSHNGFFHQNPVGSDISVEVEMQTVIGSAVVNGTVQNVRYAGAEIVGDVEVNGIIYIATSQRLCAESFWTLRAQ